MQTTYEFSVTSPEGKEVGRAVFDDYMGELEVELATGQTVKITNDKHNLLQQVRQQVD